MTIGHWLNRTLTVWRAQNTADGQGGQSQIWTLQGSVVAKVDQATVAERTLASQAGADLTHTIYLLPDADVVRNDELRSAHPVTGEAEVFTVEGFTFPSTPRYRKLATVLTQSGPGNG